MRRFLFCSTLVFAAACGNHTPGQSVCKNQVPPPAECSTQCDPSPGAPNTCAAGYHCTPDGTCDALCTQGGNECGDGYVCTADGNCESTGGSGMPPDADCPAVHFTAMPTTPSVDLVLDKSGSMGNNFGGGQTRYQAMHSGLTGSTGAITTTQSAAYFGAFLYTGNECPLAMSAGNSVARALNNASAIDTLIGNNSPGGNTPTADAIAVAVADFAANPPPSGSPPIILLATDGLPNTCNSSNSDTAGSVNAAKAAYAAGVKLFIVGLALSGTDQFLQDMANAGVGSATGQAPNCTGCAPYYNATDPASLAAAFNSIINGVISCDLSISGQVDPASAQNGTVQLNGMTLTYGSDWTVDPNGTTIHLIGAACDTLKNSTNPMVDATFPCGSVIL